MIQSHENEAAMPAIICSGWYNYNTHASMFCMKHFINNNNNMHHSIALVPGLPLTA